jgi:hypothetical protein
MRNSQDLDHLKARAVELRREGKSRREIRKNVGEDYHGCLRIDVHRSRDLYRKIEGWAEAIMSAS